MSMKRTYIFTTIAIASFVIGFNYDFIESVFKTKDSVIGLLFLIICIQFAIFDKKNQRIKMNNDSYHYSEGKNDVLKNELHRRKEEIEKLNEIIIKLIDKKENK